jgi:phage baseplate assembly protein W
MASFGSSSFGVSPYGPGTVLAHPEPPNDPPSGVKFLNYLTKDYERAADGSYRRMPTTRQRVQLAIGTEKGSSTALPNFGSEFPAKIDESYQSRSQAEAARCLDRVIKEQQIVLGQVTAEQTEIGRVEITIPYETSDGTAEEVKR